MDKKEKLYEGKAKIIYSTDETDTSIMYFKDDATAFDGAKKGTIVDKGIINNSVSSRLFEFLEAYGIDTHYIKKLSDREMCVKNVEIIPVEVILRNVAAGSIAKKMGIKEGTELKSPILELCYKNDELHDPMINDDYVAAFGYASDGELSEMKEVAMKVNWLLSHFFDERGIILVDFKLEFGRYKGALLLADEITPDGCRLWDKASGEKLDKDRFRHDLGNVEQSYNTILDRVTG